MSYRCTTCGEGLKQVRICIVINSSSLKDDNNHSTVICAGNRLCQHVSCGGHQLAVSCRCICKIEHHWIIRWSQWYCSLGNSPRERAVNAYDTVYIWRNIPLLHHNRKPTKWQYKISKHCFLLFILLFNIIAYQTCSSSVKSYRYFHYSQQVPYIITSLITNLIKNW